MSPTSAAPGPLDAHPGQLRVDPHHGAVQPVAGLFDRGRGERGSSPEQHPACRRATAASSRGSSWCRRTSDRPGSPTGPARHRGLGGDDETADPEDPSPEPGHRAALRVPSVATSTSPARTVPAPSATRKPPARTGDGAHVVPARARRRQSTRPGPDPPRTRAGLHRATALDEQPAVEGVGTDLAREFVPARNPAGSPMASMAPPRRGGERR